MLYIGKGNRLKAIHRWGPWDDVDRHAGSLLPVLGASERQRYHRMNPGAYRQCEDCGEWQVLQGRVEDPLSICERRADHGLGGFNPILVRVRTMYGGPT